MGINELNERYKTLKATLHAILDEATSGDAAPKAALARIQKLSAAALIDTFTAQLMLVPATHKVVPIVSTPEQIKAVLGDHFEPEDELLARRDYEKMVLAAPAVDEGDK